MKRTLTLLLLLVASQCFSQTDKNGNPVFNSVSTAEDSVKDFKLISNYYTLKNNISNKNSAVYIADDPTTDQIAGAAINQPSDFFVITRQGRIVNMVLMVNQPARKFMVLNPSTGKQTEFDCPIKGDITENRASEMVKEKYDPKAKIDGDKLYFNDRKLKIMPNQEIKQLVVSLIEKEQLSAGGNPGIKILSKDELKKMIVTETREAGKLDFFTKIKGHEMEGIEVEPGIIDTRIGDALFKWGHANFDLGVNTVEEALEFWEAFKGRPANMREKEYIKLGFNKGLEK